MRVQRILAGLVMILLASACGHKAPPKPPDTLQPFWGGQFEKLINGMTPGRSEDE